MSGCSSENIRDAMGSKGGLSYIQAKEPCNKDKYVTADELKKSTEFLARIAQLSEFKAEIDALKKGKCVSKTSKLKALDPFVETYHRVS
ncbi:hypothetical protein TNCT_730801 [Trichonephila clavata]|uniref:Uncharacterized protein n=1 Tax=Trichonephila clavata TaxID=2740835 RepID=A0A8X6K4Y3_TRICU|nr:hypothetical protein TNCT_730801 [Trichonephila clavata]